MDELLSGRCRLHNYEGVSLMQGNRYFVACDFQTVGSYREPNISPIVSGFFLSIMCEYNSRRMVSEGTVSWAIPDVHLVEKDQRHRRQA